MIYVIGTIGAIVYVLGGLWIMNWIVTRIFGYPPDEEDDGGRMM